MDDPAGFFEGMYVAGDMPWDRGTPHPLFSPWIASVDGAGRRALIVGSGPGADAELVATRGFAVTGFDFSPSAVELARSRHPSSPVSYFVADVLAAPAEWDGAFDLVVEILTVQSMPPETHAQAAANIAGFVAPGGTLFVVATAREEGSPLPDGPPWPLMRSEVEAFGVGGVEAVSLEEIEPNWRAEFRRRP